MGRKSAYTPRGGTWLETIGWLTLIGGAGLVLLLFGLWDRRGDSLGFLGAYSGFLFVNGVLYIVVGKQLQNYKWRNGGRILASIMVLNFPGWTLFGLIVWYFLWKGADETAEDEWAATSDGNIRKAPSL